MTRTGRAERHVLERKHDRNSVWSEGGGGGEKKKRGVRYFSLSRQVINTLVSHMRKIDPEPKHFKRERIKN